MRLLLIDDHTLFRTGLKELLERRGLEVVGAVADGREGEQLASELELDLVLLDLRMPAEDGSQVLARLQANMPTLPVVMLTTSDDDNDVVRCINAGARGYLLKDMDPDELVRYLIRAVEGEVVVAPGLVGLLDQLANGTVTTDVPVRFSSLTEREFEILHHLAEGLSNKAIALKLGIVDGTVKLHVRSILRKLGIRSRVKAAILAIEEGLARRER